MSDPTVNVRSSREAVRAALQSISQGVVANSTTTRDEALENVGNAILAHIHEAFIIKSKGGTDEAGDRWAPLSPVTLAIRHGKDKKRTPGKKRRSRINYGSMPSPSKRRIQNIIKREIGVRNRYDSKRNDILVDTGELIDSLSPWHNSPYKILKVTGNGVTLGTKREGAMDHHTGVPSRNLPQRRLWPEPANWPDTWWQDIKDEVVKGIVKSIIEKMRGM